MISKDLVLQFRPHVFKLDMDICRDAKDVFGHLAPTTRCLGVMDGISDSLTRSHSVCLHIYLQDKLPGIRLDSYRQCLPSRYSEEHQRRLVQDLANIFARAYHRRRFVHPSGPEGLEAIVKGKVGMSLQWRLDVLQSLPGEQLARDVAALKRNIQAIEQLPWCLTHGDLVASNILVDSETGALTGLVDWAEGEWLSFGIGLYGLEEVLGHEANAGPGDKFKYFNNHEELRRAFWSSLLSLCEHVPGPGTELRLQEVKLARELGIMLWRGIAFDDGRIDRVVQPGQDDMEIHKLRLFLNAPSGLDERSLGFRGPSIRLLRILCLFPCKWIWRWLCRKLNMMRGNSEG